MQPKTAAPHPALSVNALTLAFHGTQALRGVTFDVPQGAFAGLIGPNGAGKTTLFNAVSGLHCPDSGSVRLLGRDVTAAPPHRLLGLGLVRTFQLARGFPKLTVFQHLVLYAPSQPGESLFAALLATRRARAREAALAARARAVADRLRLSAVLDNPATALSGGQKKLLEIGRALMAEPRVLLLDEPMAGVNPALAEEIAARLQEINRDGTTICLIEHDMPLIRRLCDPVIVMAEGRTLTRGSFDDVASDPRVREAYMGVRH